MKIFLYSLWITGVVAAGLCARAGDSFAQRAQLPIDSVRQQHPNLVPSDISTQTTGLQHGVYRGQGHPLIRTEVYVEGTTHRDVEAHPELRTPEEQKIESCLLEITNQLLKDGSVSANAIRKAEANRPQADKPRAMQLRVDDIDRIQVYVFPMKGVTIAQLKDAVNRAGGVVETAVNGFDRLDAWVAARDIRTIAALKSVASIALVTDPNTNTGSITSEGVARLRSDVAVRVLGADGTGVKVGVMSDDCASTTGKLATSKSTGDINSNFVVVDDPFPSNTHEGLAMSEIVQDVAPGAQIYFATAFRSEVSFGQNMQLLADSGCTVITDDVSYSDENAFSDGSLANTVNSISQNGGVYTSSAGNSALNSFFGTYSNVAGTGLLAGKNVFNFPTSGNPYQPVVVGAGKTISIFLQWDDPFGGSGNDYNLYLVDPSKTHIVGSSTTVQSGFGNPYEQIASFATDSASTMTFYIVVERKTISATDPNGTARIQLTGWSTSGFTGAPATSSLYGHPAADSCLAAGAIAALRSDAGHEEYINGIQNYNTIESFSNQGPSYLISFGTGTRNIAITRQKPDIAAFDGVRTTVGGNFAEFFGTSAATPHIAGVAAQLFSAKHGITATQVRAAMRAGTMDYGTTGADYVFGYGRLDAFKTVSQALSGTGNSFAKYLTTNTAIPDGGSMNSTITPNASGTVDSVYLSFTIDQHFNYGDLVVTLQAPSGKTRTLLTRPPSGTGTSGGNTPNVVLGDNASTAIESYDPGSIGVVGLYIPQNTISTAAGFHGENISGNWKLTVTDGSANTAVGSLREWGMYFKANAGTLESLTLSATPPYIWSSDNSIQNITVNETVNNGNGAPTMTLQSVTCNEATVAGDYSGISLGTNDLSYGMRATCNALSKGRLYTATYLLTDAGGFSQTYQLQIPVMCALGHTSSAPVTGPSTTLALPTVNPFATTTQLSYTLPGAANVYLKLFDLRGKWLRNLDYGAKSSGVHNVTFDGKRADGTLLPNGTYIYQLNAGGVFRDGTVTIFR